jgi:Ser/Thr protein kinase RdoA (MazF antagonist)
VCVRVAEALSLHAVHNDTKTKLAPYRDDSTHTIEPRSHGTFDSLSVRGRLGLLRRLATQALDAYGIGPAELVLLGHVENTTFRVEVPTGERFVLRIHRVSGSPLHPPRTLAEVASEALWLAAIRRNTPLSVPEPVPANDGSMVTVADVVGLPEPRLCVLFRWQHGRFLDAGLTPVHLERVGRFIAKLHDQSSRFAPPEGFERWRIGDLSDDVRAFVAGEVREQAGPHTVAVVDEVVRRVLEARRDLGTGPDVYGLIHADLHQENYFFAGRQVCAIDFDDCGWGHHLHDLSVTLSEIRGRREYDSLRAALLHGYRAARALPTEHERYLETFQALRTLQLTLWFLEQREDPSLEGWEQDVRDGFGDLEAFVQGAS